MSVFDYGTDIEPPERRSLGDEDVRAFIEAAEVGDKTRMRPDPGGVRVSFIKFLSIKYPFRMRRLGRDLDWLRKHAKKHGLTEEDVRSML